MSFNNAAIALSVLLVLGGWVALWKKFKLWPMGVFLIAGVNFLFVHFFLVQNTTWLVLGIIYIFGAVLPLVPIVWLFDRMWREIAQLEP